MLVKIDWNIFVERPRTFCQNFRHLKIVVFFILQTILILRLFIDVGQKVMEFLKFFNPDTLFLKNVF